MVVIIKHIEIEGPGTLGEFFRETSWETKTIELTDGDRLPSLDKCEAIISLGGPMNVYEDDKSPGDSLPSDAKAMLIESYKRKDVFKRQAEMIYLNFAKVIAA